MREPILKAVSMPARILWAPSVPALLNMVCQLPFMLFYAGQGGNPLLFMGTIIGVHALIALYAAKEPHLSNMFKAQGPFFKKSSQMYTSSGRKYAP